MVQSGKELEAVKTPAASPIRWLLADDPREYFRVISHRCR